MEVAERQSQRGSGRFLSFSARPHESIMNARDGSRPAKTTAESGWFRTPPSVTCPSSSTVPCPTPGSFDGDVDAARHYLGLFRDADLEHAVGALRGDALGIRGLRQREAAEEAAADPLDAAITVRLVPVAEVPLAAQCEHAVLHAHLDVPGIDTRYVGGEDETVGLLADVDGGDPVGDGGRTLGVRRHAAGHQFVEITVEPVHQAPGFVGYKAHNGPPRCCSGTLPAPVR